MTGKTLDFWDVIKPDSLGIEIGRKWFEWNTLRQNWINECTEIRKYVFATSTRDTTNSKLPWKNSTTVPKLCQIRDNLFANYMATLFPKRKWMSWLADNEDDNSKIKRDAILNYMTWVQSQPGFKQELAKCVLDYIDYGNAFIMPEWMDQRSEEPPQSGYVGPTPRRVNPLDIVMNPLAPTFIDSPKIIRSLISIGELKKIIDSLSVDENKQEYEDIFNYFRDYRAMTKTTTSELVARDEFFRMDGFTSMHSYLLSDYVELLTFYGDIYDWGSNKLLKNHVVMVIDRHKIIGKKPNPSYFGYPPIFHIGWRKRQDNLWAMSPLANLIGMQYRIDHIENMKADVLDLIVFPVLKVKGYVEDFEWAPMERIVTSEEGDVEMLAPPFQVLQMNQEIKQYTDHMEEMAGSPKEAMGFRTPGEKTAYEVQRQENAAGRIFANKTTQFEEYFTEPFLNSCLEMAKRNISGPQQVNVFDDDFKIQVFQELTSDDITGAGKIKPIAARHFAERAELVQNLTQLYGTILQNDPEVKAHFSTIKTAKMLEEVLDIADFKLVQPFIRLSEQQDGKKLMMQGEEAAQNEFMTPSGLTPGDHDQDQGQQLQQAVGPPQGIPQ